MSRAREELVPPQPMVVASWKASAYQFCKPPEPMKIKAAHGAIWERGTPLANYQPAGKRREMKMGPHFSFLKLKGLLTDRSDLYDETLALFATTFGLLGLFDEEFSSPRPTDETKMLVAPEAKIEANGRLQSIDPATEGKELLLDLLRDRGYFKGERKRELARLDRRVALPNELECARKRRTGFWRAEVVPWEQAKLDYRGMLILDEEADEGVSVLCTEEPYIEWRMALEMFPEPDELSERELKACLNERLAAGVFPHFPEDEEGYRRGYRCSTLLKAIHFLLWLDISGGNSIRKCASRGCPNYFRIGSQSNAVYCTDPKCASRESSRRYYERQKTR